ncbi:hypothetical protein [Pseudooceanicola nanhaiensis]|uniref:hypothetical protein n=1 Tax=Pseudooceanicola nanhaiensis TaxID=375761 RepID=UPI001CD2A83A|nr:hypothetical protein [Pseudooceanicola nanhaiensis]MCA0920184.1 hypothetical protein [Pseudooceanicola nanhaiensis]
MVLQMMQAVQDWQTLTLSSVRVACDAGTVIHMRLMQIALGQMEAEEATRMVLEKPATFARSAEMSARALAANRGVAAAAIAGMKPIERTTRSNARRLTGATPQPARRR